MLEERTRAAARPSRAAANWSRSCAPCGGVSTATAGGSTCITQICAVRALTKLAALQSATGEKAEADRVRERMRVAAIEREYAAKLDDLRHNYALRVTVDWVQGLVLFAPVHRYEVLIRRRKGER